MSNEENTEPATSGQIEHVDPGEMREAAEAEAEPTASEEEAWDKSMCPKCIATGTALAKNHGIEESGLQAFAAAVGDPTTAAGQQWLCLLNETRTRALAIAERMPEEDRATFGENVEAHTSGYLAYCLAGLDGLAA